MGARSTGNVFVEYFENLLNWPGTTTTFTILGASPTAILEANDSATWASTTTWDAFARWNTTPTSPCVYTAPERDLGTILAGQVDSTIDADGTTLIEMRSGNTSGALGAWGSATAPFTARYIQMRVTVTATGGAPVPAVRTWSYNVSVNLKREYINDVVISALAGSYRIGVGDIRVPLANTYSVIKSIGVTVQDSSAGSWTVARIDNVLTYGPRYQFRLAGVLADPSFVDFDIQGI